MKNLSVIELSLFASRIDAICEEMGAVLQRTAFSPNIKDRLDFSCAVFDKRGALCAQAAHIPVHMGSMAYAMREIVTGVQWHAGDMLILNDPYLGGTHLPDVTVIAPLFVDRALMGFIANRAHHADIGSETPGSMPISKSLHEEGVVISPQLLVKANQICGEVLAAIVDKTHNQRQTEGDFAAQISANRTGLKRLTAMVTQLGAKQYETSLSELNAYAKRLAQSALSAIPDGNYYFTDVMDDDGAGTQNIPIAVTVKVSGQQIEVDFSGTAAQTPGNINCPISVAAAGVYYVFRCLMPAQTPNCSGSFSAISIYAEEGSLLNAKYPAAVAAGNVETSMRVVDVIMGALAQAMPHTVSAASQGTMNNLAMGAHGGEIQAKLPNKHALTWDYYETIGGGMGAGSKCSGISGVQSHMTNTRNTPIEVLEMAYPIRVNCYKIRENSGGEGTHSGGDGIVRQYEFLAPAIVTLLTERRSNSPWGLAGGSDGAAGRNLLNSREIAAKYSGRINCGDKITVETPGGGGWGPLTQSTSATS